MAVDRNSSPPSDPADPPGLGSFSRRRSARQAEKAKQAPPTSLSAISSKPPTPLKKQPTPTPTPTPAEKPRSLEDGEIGPAEEETRRAAAANAAAEKATALPDADAQMTDASSVQVVPVPRSPRELESVASSRESSPVPRSKVDAQQLQQQSPPPSTAATSATATTATTTSVHSPTPTETKPPAPQLPTPSQSPPLVPSAKEEHYILSMTPEELDHAKSLVLDLLGWGVHPEYLLECGVSSRAIHKIFTDLHLRLPANLKVT